MIIGDIETTEKVEYEDLLKNYYEKMEIIEEQDKEIERLNNIINKKEQFLGDNIKRLEREVVKRDNIINELENRDDVLEEFEDWLERQKTRNSEWDNFIMVDVRLGIPVSYLLNKLQELKGSDKE